MYKTMDYLSPKIVSFYKAIRDYHLCAKFQSCSKESHLSVIERILRYLKGTIDLGLWYLKCDSVDLIGFSNVDFVECKIDRKSTN